MFDQVLERAPFGDQLRSALFSDSLHARNVVAGIADQRAQIENAVGPHTEALLDFRWPVAAILHTVEQRDAIADELHQVLVGGHDGDLRVFRSALDECGNHVIGFEVRHRNDGDPVRVDEFANDRKLDREILGLGFPIGLVGVVERVAEGRAARVEYHDHAIGRLFANHLAEHVDEAVGGVGRGAVGRAKRGNRKERPVERVGAVDEKNLAGHARRPG